MTTSLRSRAARRAWAAIALAGILAGCADAEPPVIASPALPQAAPELADFYELLRREYLEVSAYHAAERDWFNTDLFRSKAEQVEAGLAVEAEVPGDGVPETLIAELEQARAIMTTALRAGGRLFSPQLAADTQVSYDCWLRGEQLPHHMSDRVLCRYLFQFSLARLQQSLQGSMFTVLANPDGTPSTISIASESGRVELSQPSEATILGNAAAPPRPPVRMDPATMEEVFGAALSAEVPPPVRFFLYYESGSVLAMPEFDGLIGDILATIRQRPGSHISIIGHADQRGSDQVNTALALRRAQLVRQRLIREGIAPDRIEAISYGTRTPEVDAPPGTDEPRNRRVVVTVQ